MTTKVTGVIAAGFLAIGMVVGAAGTIVSRDDAAPDMAGHMRDITSMMSMMGAGSMDDMASMMSMMGGDTPMNPRASMGPDASMSPDEHGPHHASPSPEATR